MFDSVLASIYECIIYVQDVCDERKYAWTNQIIKKIIQRLEELCCNVFNNRYLLLFSFKKN